MAFIKGKRVLCATVNLTQGTGGGEPIQLFAPTISLSGSTIVIEDADNGAHVQSYDLYDGERRLGNSTEKVINLSTYATEIGTYNFMVAAKGNKFVDSDFSNVITYVKTAGTDGLVYALNSDGVSYSCTGYGTATDTDVIIASEYEGLPVTKISEDAFKKCTNIISVYIPDSVTSTGSYVFSGCESLTTVRLSNFMTSITTNMFSSCDALASIDIPDNIVSISADAFNACTNLTNISVGETHSKYSTKDGSLYNKDFTTIIRYATGKTDASFIVPDSVTIIGNRAFDFAKNLTNVTISDNVTNIGAYAFNNAGGGINGMMKKITVGSAVSYLGSVCFGNISYINEFEFKSATPPRMYDSQTFINSTHKAVITVPAGCGEAYKAADGWSSYADEIVEAEA